MRSKQSFANFCLLLAAFLWGSTFIAQAESTVGTFTYLACRSVIGALFLLPVILLMDGRRKKRGTFSKMTAAEKRVFLSAGIVCGIVLLTASFLQQFGIDRGTAPGKAGFITAMYILLVPILGLFLKKRVAARHWVCVGFGIVGLFLLCMTEGLTEFSLAALFSAETLSGLSVQTADLYVIACAVVYAVHILLLDKFVPHIDPVKLSCLQFAVLAVVATVLALLFEQPTWDGIWQSRLPIAYAGVLSSGVAYTLQAVAQRDADASVASMLMSMESPFAVLSAIVFYGITTGVPQLPTPYEWVGIALMFAAILISQYEPKKKTSQA